MTPTITKQNTDTAIDAEQAPVHEGQLGNRSVKREYVDNPATCREFCIVCRYVFCGWDPDKLLREQQEAERDARNGRVPSFT